MSYLLHTRRYDAILKATSFDFIEYKKDYARVKYQALASFYLKNYYHSKKCYELLDGDSKLNSAEYLKLAYLYTRHNEKEKAIITFCKAADRNPGEKKAKACLEYIKSRGREINLIDDQFFEKTLTKEPAFIPFDKIFIVLIVILALALAVLFGAEPAKKAYKKFMRSRADGKVISVNLDDFNPMIIREPKDYKKTYSYDESEVKSIFSQIKTHIIAGEYNSAQILINKLNISNASQDVKIKVEILQSFIDEDKVDYFYFKNNINYSEVIKEPALYNKIYVKWQGKAVNKSASKSGLFCNLVLGDEETGVITGVVPVEFIKPSIFYNNDEVMIFGRLSAVNGKIMIKGEYLLKL